jgi:hypothetical protein
LPGCRIDAEASPQFAALKEHWKRAGYDSIESDLKEAFQEIVKDIQACRCRPVGRFADVIGDLQLLKYRQKNRAAREGARGGWRIYALFDRERLVLYPIVVYPKKQWADASDDLIKKAVKQLRDIVAKPRFLEPPDASSQSV